MSLRNCEFVFGNSSIPVSILLSLPKFYSLHESHYRSILKSISWRIIGTIDTIIVSWLIIGEGGQFKALSIGFSELLTKMALYYGHERFWVWLLRKYQWSQTPRVSVIKAISWRIVGTMDTIVLATLITGNPLTGLKIGGTELLTKIVLYYLHERAWARLPLGTVRKWFGRK